MGALGILGMLLAFVGWVWLIVTAVRSGATTQDKVIWGLVCALGCPPIGGIIYYVVKRNGLVPLLVSIAGNVVLYLGGGMSAWSNLGSMP